ncbi:glycosyltransferase [Aeromicrobium camelliae]|uniref:Glycosyltransferase n=1 Tax=Aeromicrobium camelliae TaxID=1538144 RepID=A0A3N6WNC5_9ACTN|nr:glycosyltransferase [Aeromicrobium camelliae]RQN08949.1 glycosyltransferase [Aeromicrobium camelliae]
MAAVDIVIPYWGDPDLLTLTVDSVLGQDDDDWTLTILDDHYPDLTAYERYRDHPDPRVTYVRHEQNVGITANFAQAAQRATADYVCIPGSDDLFDPGYVRTVKGAIARHPGVDIVQPGVRVIDQHGEPSLPLVDRVKRRMLAPREETVLAAEDLATSLIRGNWLYWPSLTFRTETLRRHDFRDGFPVIQDLALLMDIAYTGGSLVYTPEVAFAYRRHDGSASMAALVGGSRFRDERRYYRLAHRLAVDHGWRRTARAARLRIFSRLHAATVLPRALLQRDGQGIRSALAHLLGP